MNVTPSIVMLGAVLVEPAISMPFASGRASCSATGPLPAALMVRFFVRRISCAS